MSNRNLILRSAGYCLSALFVVAVATSGDAFAAPPDQAQGKGKPGAKPVLQIESMGARAFGGTTNPVFILGNVSRLFSNRFRAPQSDSAPAD